MTANTSEPFSLLQVERRLVRQAVALCAVFSLGFNLLMLTAPIYMMQVFDRVLSTRNFETLLVLSLIALFALMAMSMLDDARNRVLSRLGRGLELDLLPAVLRAGFASSRVGDRPGQAMRDLATIRGFLGNASVLPFLDAPWAPLFLLVIYLIHPVLGHLTLFGGLVLLGLALAINAATRRPTLSGNGAVSRVTREIDLASRGADTVKAMGLLDSLTDRWRARMTEAAGDLQLGADRTSGLTALSKFVRMGLQIGVMGTGAYLVIEGEISPGSMLAGSILLARALAPAEQAIGGWRAFVSARDAWRQVRGLLADRAESEPDMTMPAPPGETHGA